MFGLGSEYKQFLEALAPGQFLDHGQDLIAPARTPIGRVHRETGKLSRALIRVAVECGATHNRAITLRYHETVDFSLQHLPRPAHQDTLLLQRLNQLQHTANILNPGLADLLVVIATDQGAGAIPGEELLEHRTVVNIADDVRPAHPFYTGITGGFQQVCVMTGDHTGREPLGRLTR